MLIGKELGAALTRAMQLKGVSNADVAREFRIKPPSVCDWKKYGRIGKQHIHHLVDYFADVVGPDHWGIRSTASLAMTSGQEELHRAVMRWGARLTASECHHLAGLITATAMRAAQSATGPMMDGDGGPTQTGAAEKSQPVPAAAGLVIHVAAGCNVYLGPGTIYAGPRLGGRNPERSA